MHKITPARNVAVNLLPWSFSATTITGSNFGNLTAFRAIFSHIFTAHAQERPFMNFRLKFWHHHSIPWSRFPYRARYFGDTRTFSVDFCLGYAECPPYFYFRCSWPTDLESVSRDAHLAVTVSTKFEVDTTIRCLVIALWRLFHSLGSAVWLLFLALLMCGYLGFGLA